MGNAVTNQPNRTLWRGVPKSRASRCTLALLAACALLTPGSVTADPAGPSSSASTSESKSASKKPQTPPQTPCARAIRMDLAGLDRGIRRLDPKAVRQGSAWRLTLKQRVVQVIADPKAQRMRILSPVVPVNETTEAERLAMLTANFHTALDARYAVSQGFVLALFVHPLPTLTESALSDALRQVASLADNFGSTYSSDSLLFGGPSPPAGNSQNPQTL